MTKSFSEMKKNRSNSLSKLTEQLDKMNTNYSNSSDDDKFWKLSVDKAGNGRAIIRFLPATKDEEIPFVRIWDHGFQGPGGWYIENSLTTLGKDDPCSEYNTKLWNNETEDGKKQARKQKRRINYFANILVVEDYANPENNGKVFLFKFGQKIFDKLNSAMNPEFEDDLQFNPFDFWEGADFNLRARNGDNGYRSYDSSRFETPNIISDSNGELSEERIEYVWESQYNLQDLLSPENFKSYDELKAKLYKVLKLTNDDIDIDDDYDKAEPKAQKSKESKAISRVEEIEEDDDDDLDFFKKLANEE